MPVKLILQFIRAQSSMSAAEQQQNLSVIVFGYTGLTGNVLLGVLAKNPRFSKVSLLGRREVPLPDEVAATGKFQQKQLDFDKLVENPESQGELFTGHDAAFCCLGTTRGKSGVDGFIKVDHDYIMATAKASKAAHVKQFHLVSSAGASKSSMLLYPRVKGQVEEELTSLGFDRLAIYRPKMIISQRRPGESIFVTLTRPFQHVCPTLLTTPTDILARAMVNSALLSGNQDSKLDLYCNSSIFQLADRSD